MKRKLSSYQKKSVDIIILVVKADSYTFTANVSGLSPDQTLSFVVWDPSMALRVWASQAATSLGIGCRRPLRSLGFPAVPFCRQFSDVIEGLKYADSHEWVKSDGTVGITHHAQDHLGDVVFVDLPEVGATVSKGSSFGAVESVKATSDINAPVSGEVVETNTKLTETPALINGSPYDEGWMIKVRIKDPSEMDTLMNAEQYKHFCDEEDASH